MVAKYEPTHKVKCPECKWSETYDTKAFADSAVKLHNKDMHPGVITILDGIVLSRDKDKWTITMENKDLETISIQQLYDNVQYMAGIALTKDV